MARSQKPLPQGPVRAHVEFLDHEGRGVARVQGKVTCIDGALPGEEVRFRYRRIRGRFDEGRVVEVLQASSDRVVPRCPHFGVCGGCTLQHLHPEAQLRAKQARLLETLEHLGGVEPPEVFPPLTGPLWGYRRKARLGVRYVAKKGRLLVGFRERGSRFVADLSRCEVLDPAVGQRLVALQDLIASLEPFDRIPQVEVAVGDQGTALVFRHLVPLPEADREALRSFGAAHGLRVYLQPGGPETVSVLYPETEAELSYRLAAWDVDLQFQPTDFAQVNGELNQQMVARALELLGAGPCDRVLDLFCGLGNFTLPLSRSAGQVVGVEGDDGLVGRARQNARRNGIDNVTFHVDDLSRPSATGVWREGAYDRLLLDPPRSGAPQVLAVLAEPYPRRVVYVSCNPATLARDAGELVRTHGYRLAGAGIIDMFPHTAHVESIAVFDR